LYTEIFHKYLSSLLRPNEVCYLTDRENCEEAKGLRSLMISADNIAEIRAILQEHPNKFFGWETRHGELHTIGKMDRPSEDQYLEVSVGDRVYYR
jgi:hypothetical protein